jgi:hypothetical protein
MKRSKHFALKVERKSTGTEARKLVDSFLKDALKLGPVKTSELEIAARKIGLLRRDHAIGQSKPFLKAKTRLAIRSRRVGFGGEGGWTWELSHSPLAAKGVQHAAVTAPPKTIEAGREPFRSGPLLCRAVSVMTAAM